MKITYLICRPTMKFPFVAWLIMLAQGMKPWDKNANSHRALQYSIMGETQWVLDSTSSNGVKENWLTAFKVHYKIIDQIEFDIKVDRSDFIKWLTRQVGKKYDFLDVFGDLMRVLNIVSFNKIGRNYKRLTCNEVFISFCQEVLNIDLGDPDQYDLLSTDEIARKLKRGDYGHIS